METMTVKDLMVPLEEYATVSQDATLYEAVMALEKAHEELDRTRYKYLHRAILAFDENNHVVGKLSQLDVLKALEPKYREMGDPGRLSRAGFSPQFLESIMEHHALWDKPLVDICKRATELVVKDFMYTPTEGEFVDQNDSLAKAIHQLVMGHHQSLLVTKGEEIVGRLRLTDVFKDVFQRVQSCEV
jgi:CBS domain-containing protein